MRHPLPEPFQVLSGQLSRLPGLGPKSAMRAAMALLKWPEAETRRLGETIFTLRDRLCICSRCGALSDTDPCSLCLDPDRDDSVLCVVSDWDSMLTLEEGGFYQGRYFLLGDHFRPGESEESRAELCRLMDRISDGKVREVVFALGSTLEAEAAATFFAGMLRKSFPELIITRPAQGIPLGAEIRFMDRETLRQSLCYRQKLA